jgi:hypothetical protein
MGARINARNAERFEFFDGLRLALRRFLFWLPFALLAGSSSHGEKEKVQPFNCGARVVLDEHTL